GVLSSVFRQRMQLSNKPIKAGGKASPISQPFAWKPKRDLDALERTLVDAGAAHRTSRPRATGEELLRLFPEIDEVFSLVGRAGPERQKRKPVGTGRRLRLDIARIDAAQPFRRWQHRAKPGDGDEQAVARIHWWQRRCYVGLRFHRGYLRLGIGL